MLGTQTNHGLSNFVKTGGLWEPRHDYFAHEHDYWEIVIYVHGEGTLVAGPHRLPFKPGTGVCIPPHMMHHETDTKAGYMNRWVAVERFSSKDPMPTFTVDLRHPLLSLLA